MPKLIKESLPAARDPAPRALRSIRQNGTAPDSRLRDAYQAYEIAEELDRADAKRRIKRSRIYKAYNRFPPTEYSKLAKDGEAWQSNVNFGMLAFIVDNTIASFYDMLTERVVAAQITTKVGTPTQRGDWGEHISTAFDLALDRWDGFLFNQEEGLLDMGLYGKGIEMWEGNDGMETKHVSADEVLVPDTTKIDFSNFDVLVVKWKFPLHDLYDAIKDQETAEDMGWNVEAVIEAMRWKRDIWRRKTNEDFLHDIQEGNITITAHLRDTVSCYIVFIKEFDGKISKHIVLRDYAPAFLLTREDGRSHRAPAIDSQEFKGKVNEMGFLFTKTGMFDSHKNVFAVFIDNAGSGKWHNTPSLAEKVFVHARQYDFAMNGIMDAIKINMSLILQGQSGEATEKLKQIVFGPYMIIPDGVTVAQHRLQLDTQMATEALQFMMLDMKRGIGNYQVHEKTSSGEAPTATQTNIDAMEGAKLSGTQLRRFNGQHSRYYRELYRRLVAMTQGEEGYEIFKEFRDYLDANQVPREAWEYENIHTIKSCMLSGAGSPSYKLMAANQTIAFTNIVPKDEGQSNAIRDGISALQGRQNVDRYMPKKQQPDPTWSERVIGHENEIAESAVLNPRNLMVYSSDNHIEHINGHLSDMARSLALAQQAIKQKQANKEDMKAIATKLLNMGGHVNAHMGYLSKDEGKKEQYDQFAEGLKKIQGAADKLAKQLQKLQKEQADNATGDLQNDPEVRKQLALSQIAISTKEQLANISIGAIATKHQQRLKVDKEKASNQIAIERAKAVDKLETNRKARRTEK